MTGGGNEDEGVLSRFLKAEALPKWNKTPQAVTA
jgi:hypothetical protein